MRNRKFRKVVPQENSLTPPYKFAGVGIFVSSLLLAIMLVWHDLLQARFILFFVIGSLVASIVAYRHLRGFAGEVSVFPLEADGMSYEALRLARRVLSRFDDVTITDILKLSNNTRYGNVIPGVFVWVSDDLSEGLIAIENISNYDRLNKASYEQQISGVLSGDLQGYSVVKSYLSKGDSFVVFAFEDVFCNNRLEIDTGLGNDAIEPFVEEDSRAIRLAKDLIWHADRVPHLSIIARTRAGKSYFAGNYLAVLMKRNGWCVEYNSAKNDIYVEKFNGKYEPADIVLRAESWVLNMKSRLAMIAELGKASYLEVAGKFHQYDALRDVAVFFDELGTLNAYLESDKKLKQRWQDAITALLSTGGSAGIHVIAISQHGTNDGFLPSRARINCSDAVIMLGGAADSAEERKYMMPGFADMPKRSYGLGQGVARILYSGKKWEEPHFYETPLFR